MNIFIIVSLFSAFCLDFFLFYLISFSFNNIMFCFPMFFLVTNILLFKYLNNKNIYIYIFFVIFYSSIILNNCILGLILFIWIYFLNRLLLFLPLWIRCLVLLFFYDLLFYLILVVFNNWIFSIFIYFYKIVRSFLLNSIYLFLFDLVLKKVDS